MVTHDEIARVSKTPEDFGQLDIPDYRESRGSDGRGLRVCGKLRELARDRGFYRHDNPHNELACGLLYGGVAYVMKPDLDECYRNRCTGYVNALLQSFEINYFDKIAIAALVLNEICEPVVGV